jgi:hypothetical protein
MVNSCSDVLIVDEASIHKGTAKCWISFYVSTAGYSAISLGIVLWSRIIKRILENAPM